MDPSGGRKGDESHEVYDLTAGSMQRLYELLEFSSHSMKSLIDLIVCECFFYRDERSGKECTDLCKKINIRGVQLNMDIKLPTTALKGGECNEKT